MPKNKIVYSKDLDYSYVVGPDGKQIGGMEGDQSNNPLAMDQGAADILKMDKPYTPTTGAENVKHLENRFTDAMVDIASQAPMMIPGVGIPAKAAKYGGSFLSGLAADRMLNGENKSMANSVADAGINTAVGAFMPKWLENEIKLNPKFKVGGGIFTKMAALLTNPLTFEPRTEIRNVVGRGVGGQFTKAAPKVFPKTYSGVQKALAGLFGNLFVDNTVNTPE